MNTIQMGAAPSPLAQGRANGNGKMPRKRGQRLLKSSGGSSALRILVSLAAVCSGLCWAPELGVRALHCSRGSNLVWALCFGVPCTQGKKHGRDAQKDSKAGS